MLKVNFAGKIPNCIIAPTCCSSLPKAIGAAVKAVSEAQKKLPHLQVDAAATCCAQVLLESLSDMRHMPQEDIEGLLMHPDMSDTL